MATIHQYNGANYYTLGHVYPRTSLRMPLARRRRHATELLLVVPPGPPVNPIGPICPCTNLIVVGGQADILAVGGCATISAIGGSAEIQAECEC